MTAARTTATLAPTASELETQVNAEREALAKAESRLAELAGERAAALLADDDAPLADAEAALEATRRHRDRHAARVELLERARDDAVAAERYAEALERYESARTQIDVARTWLMETYPRLADELAAGLAQLRAADELAERVNRQALPAGCAPLVASSIARHESATNDRRETRRVRRWVDRNGRPVGAVQTNAAGVPNVFGARLVTVEEEVFVAGERPWFPQPVYSEIGLLPGLRRGDRRFWPPED